MLLAKIVELQSKSMTDNRRKVHQLLLFPQIATDYVWKWLMRPGNLEEGEKQERCRYVSAECGGLSLVAFEFSTFIELSEKFGVDRVEGWHYLSFLLLLSQVNSRSPSNFSDVALCLAYANLINDEQQMGVSKCFLPRQVCCDKECVRKKFLYNLANILTPQSQVILHRISGGWGRAPATSWSQVCSTKWGRVIQWRVQGPKWFKDAWYFKFRQLIFKQHCRVTPSV